MALGRPECPRATQYRMCCSDTDELFAAGNPGFPRNSGLASLPLFSTVCSIFFWPHYGMQYTGRRNTCPSKGRGPARLYPFWRTWLCSPWGRGRALTPVRWLFDLYCACVLRERGSREPAKPPQTSSHVSGRYPPPFAHARPCLRTWWALNRCFEEILGPLFLWSRMDDWVFVARLYRERGAQSCL